ncbi:hypothetical protein M2454_002317 [Aequitasia blattaphilus]|uniref:Uncharacterized protein n=1 Tax=Aequitasia blattaphilus TaxID=2949332 RepID=A0ABT1EBF4_9FIRM|nr:hypothetical protein [Aequitasia blattaphilus]MCP1103169.1 hypothetical protein [Aequitasia blattaphilus]MCR8615809.1 hypothetical protein [Aequitasia blattaphilus]
MAEMVYNRIRNKNEHDKRANVVIRHDVVGEVFVWCELYYLSIEKEL